MKTTKFLAIGLALAAFTITSCDIAKPYESISGIDSSKAKPANLTLDTDNTSSTGVSVYWDGTEAVQAGALSFTTQLVEEIDGAGDNYNSKVSKTVMSTDEVGNINDAASFTGLKTGDRYYVRVRANYAYSVYSEWVYLMQEDAAIQISVGNGIVIGEFIAPTGLTATTPTYSTMQVKWTLIGPADKYEVSYKTSDGNDWQVSNITDAVTTQVTIIGLSQLTSYDVRVRAGRTNAETSAEEWTDYAELTNITTPEKPQFSPIIKDAEQLTEFFSSIAAQAGAADSYTLDADIDLKGATLDCVEEFACQFDGQGHAIKNVVVNGNLINNLTGSFKNTKLVGAQLHNGLIAIVNAGALVSGIELDATTKVDFPEPTEATNYGSIVNGNAGTVENCKSAVDYNQTFDALPKATCNFGGIVGATMGLVKGCSNSGTHFVGVTAPKSGAFHANGGVVGYFEGKEGQIMVQDCSNSGAVTSEIGTACYFQTGGVVGATKSVKQSAEDPVNMGTIDNCHNTGAVAIHYIAGGSGAYPIIGGVAGQVDGYVQNCTNNGPITLTCDSESSTWTCHRVGGVAGIVTFGGINNTNKAGGTIKISALVAGGTAGARGAGNIETSCWGGVFANAGPYKPNNDIVFEKCVNEAKLDFEANSTTGTPNHHVGGVIGYSTATLKDCHNKADIKFKSPVAYSRLGGITGGAKADVISCTNTGALTLNIGNLADGSSVIGTGKFSGYVGGIIGCTRLASSAIKVTDCSNSGDLLLDASEQKASSIYKAFIAGIVGCYKPDYTPEISGCTNTGMMSCTGSIAYETSELLGGTYQAAK